MLYGISGEGEDCIEVRCMGYGAHHVMLFWAFGGNKAAGEASGDGKTSRGHGTSSVLSTITGVQEIWLLFVRVEEEVKLVLT